MAEEVSQEQQNIELAARKKQLLIFWLRIIGWIATGTVIPISTFAIKFGLFTEEGYQIVTDELGNVTSMHVALNGWGMVSVCLVGYMLYQILSTVLEHKEGYTFMNQILDGLKKTILPLAIVLGVMFFLNHVIDQVIFCLSIIIISQCAAIPLNPLPKWKYEKQNVVDYSDPLISALKTFIRKENKHHGKA